MVVLRQSDSGFDCSVRGRGFNSRSMRIFLCKKCIFVILYIYLYIYVNILLVCEGGKVLEFCMFVLFVSSTVASKILNRFY